MKRQNRKYFIIGVTVSLCAAVVGIGAGTGQAPAKFAAAPAMIEARSGACAAPLADGRVLVTGGEGPLGVLATAEFLGSGGAGEPAAPMSFPRSGHVCVTLGDGSVLVAGGRSSGGETNAAEIFDPAANAWRIIAPMSAARSGATASLLADGRVLIAGGESSGAALATLEIFDAAAGRFDPVPGAMSAPRKHHAAAVLKDGRVAIFGGSNGEAALASVDLFDPATGLIEPLGKMTVARAGLSATTLLDGRVFLAGGNDGRADVASTEIFDPATGQFAPGAPMDIPRRGHIALRIPKNNTVLIAGGTSAGEPLAAAGLYVPWWDSYRPHGVMAIGRYAAAATSVGDKGVVVLAGGATKSASTNIVELSAEPTIQTDKLDYAPGDWVTISGANWTPGATVDLVVKVLPDRTVTRWQGTATAAADGTVLKANAFQMNDTDLGKTFELTAVEQATLKTAAAWAFTDARNWVLTFAGTGAGSVTITPNSGTVNAPTNCGGSGTDALSQTVTSTCSPNITTTANDAIITLSAAAATGSVFAGWSNANGLSSSTCLGTTPTCSAVIGPNASLTVTFNLAAKADTTTAVSSNANPSFFGQLVTFTAAVTRSSGSNTPTGTVTFKDGTTTLGSGTLSGSGATATATFATSALAVGTHSITAEYAGDANFNGSTSSALSQVVNKRATQTVVSIVPGTINEGQSATVTATVTDVEPGETKFNPTGTVSFSSSSTKVTLSAASCTLSNASNGSASCWVSVTGLDGPDTPTITATYGGSEIHIGSTGGAGLTINNVPPVISVTGPVDPVKVGAATSITAYFTDPGVFDTHTCSINWDDGNTTPGIVNETNGSGSCTGTRTYSQAGVYTITVEITDKDNGTATSQFEYIVVYDPSAGFVTGGGWIDSPGGAYTAAPTLTGKATFGFVSKYQKGANVPTGNTEFQFHVAKFNFSSTAYQWLVIAGAKAQYKGTGTVNGAGNYGFLLTATDGQINGGGGVDKFRIKIWDIDTGTVVYDNASGNPDDIDSANPQAIAGGSIVIHSK